MGRFLSLVLRHKPETIDIALDDAGWADVGELIAACSKHGRALTREQLDAIVAGDDKQRFAFSQDGRRIRASQGHSIDIDLGYEPQEPPPVLYHGTAARFLESIRRGGLEPRERHHVHLSLERQTAVSVGSRHGTPVVLRIDAKRMHADGHEFLVSANGVWLTERVPAEYIEFPR